jgi:hypothetical protein
VKHPEQGANYVSVFSSSHSAPFRAYRGDVHFVSVFPLLGEPPGFIWRRPRPAWASSCFRFAPTRRAFVSGSFFICDRFVKSVKVGIHRRGVCATALTRVDTNPRRSAPFGLLAPSISRHRCYTSTSHRTRAAEYASQILAIRQNDAPPVGARRGRAACGVPQPARCRFPVSHVRRKGFRTRRFAVRVCGVLPYRLAWKKWFGLGGGGEPGGWHATQVHACGVALRGVRGRYARPQVPHAPAGVPTPRRNRGKAREKGALLVAA